ncbi:MAG: energy-coupling factor ABC transporter permease [Methanomassiliicoccaceae archaeon]|jgi:cobalamin biosynthesis protein CbiM/cobalt ECF transporter T component CbiQ|nr:energy-coupling factor ABC transporter permease [Methanomassiliicoccaceae archaeon]
MHIIEGFLPLPWAVFWTALCIPFIIFGIRSMRNLFNEHPEKKLSLALSGAFIVILSALKIPSVTGSSSHPTGTGMCVMLSGPAVTTVICTIVLLFQGTFMAHGGFTTLGANAFSMGVAGPFAAYFVYRTLRKSGLRPAVTVFATVFTANVVTYTVTALQLALTVPFTGVEVFANTYATFFGIFTITQLPIAMAEGVLMIFFFRYLAEVRPDVVKDAGFAAADRRGGSMLSAEGKSRMSRGRVAIICFSASLIAIILAVYITSFFFDFGGADDLGATTVFEITGSPQWTENIIQIGESGISVLFAVQTAIGALMLAAAIYLLTRKKHDHGNEFNTVDIAAYGSPMLRWSPLAKLFLVFSLLVMNIASPSVWMPVLSGIVGLSLFLYGSSLRPPGVMMRLFIYAQTFILIGAVIFAVVIPGEMVMRMTIAGLSITFTDVGVSFAVLLYLRATAAILLMFAFAVSTPVPHLSAALKRLRLPDVFVEMMVLIYRYTFLLMESAERMHLAAECRFGYSSYGKSMRTTSKLFVGTFMRSMDTAERGQITLQCRNYRGEFRSLSEFDERNRWPTALCMTFVLAAAAFFLVLQEVIVI